MIPAAAPGTLFLFASSATPPLSPTVEEVQDKGTVQELVQRYSACWNPCFNCFEFGNYSTENFLRLLVHHLSKYSPYNRATEQGFIEKVDLPPGSQLFLRADLHGGLNDLLQNLETLKKEGYLDAEYRCVPNFYMVLLGDYADRGKSSIQVLELLLALKKENPEQMFLIRGNHEYSWVNLQFGGNDPIFKAFLPQNCQILDSVYETFPLALYIKEVGAPQDQHVFMTHGAFEFHVDPDPMFLSSQPRCLMTIPIKRDLSERVKKLGPNFAVKYEEMLKTAPKEARKQLKLEWAASRIKELWAIQSPPNERATAYNWGDVDPSLSTPQGVFFCRSWRVSHRDLKHYLTLTGARFLFRGHQHDQVHHEVNQKVMATTLPVGLDVPIYDSPDDVAYVLKIAPKVTNWQKKRYLRTIEDKETTVSPFYPLKSKEV